MRGRLTLLAMGLALSCSGSENAPPSDAGASDATTPDAGGDTTTPVSDGAADATTDGGGDAAPDAPPGACVPNPPTFTKYAGNPVLPVGAPNAWDSEEVEGPFVVAGDAGDFMMWYEGQRDGGIPLDHIGIARQAALDAGWIKDPGNPTFAGSGNSGAWDTFGPAEPGFAFDNGKWWMWYASAAADGIIRIGLASSTSGGAPWSLENDAGAVLAPSVPSGAWNSGGMSGPRVIKEGGVYKMWMHGYDKPFDQGAQTTIGYATSSDGVHWTPYAQNPVVKVGNSGDPDQLGLLTPWVMHEGAVYHMFYTCIGPDSPPKNWTMSICYACSNDGVQWTRYSGNPIVKPGAAGAWDGDRLGTTAVVHDAGGWKLWYAGSATRPATPDAQVGLATAP